MDKLLPVVLTIVLLGLMFGLLGWGWRNRLKRHADLEQLPGMPAELGKELFSAEGTYVATTTSGDWLDRVAAQQLGLRTRAVLLVFESGVLLNRDGVPDVFIPAESLTEIRTESGMAGKFVEKDGLIVITWLLGEQALDTGFRTREAAAKQPALTTLKSILPGEATLEKRTNS